jgi:hypothetical protein
MVIGMVIGMMIEMMIGMMLNFDQDSLTGALSGTALVARRFFSSSVFSSVRTRSNMYIIRVLSSILRRVVSLNRLLYAGGRFYYNFRKRQSISALWKISIK